MAEEDYRSIRHKKLKATRPETNLADFPDDVLINIFKHLDFVTLTRISSLCKKFYDVYNDSKLYTDVYLKYDMDTDYMTAYINKVVYPKRVHIEYMHVRSEEMPARNYSEFDEYVTWLIQKCSASILNFNLENCYNDVIISLICQCRQLIWLRCYNCHGNFDALPNLKNLTSITFQSCDIQNKVMIDILEKNPNITKLHLDNNHKVNMTEVCQTISKNNKCIEELHLCDIKRLRSKGLKTLCRCSNLRVLELIGTPFACEPEDSLELLAAGCSSLERLVIHGWQNVNDVNFMPIIHFCMKLKEVELSQVKVTIKSCREAALSLPFLQNITIYNCSSVNESQIVKLQKDFDNIVVVSY